MDMPPQDRLYRRCYLVLMFLAYFAAKGQSYGAQSVNLLPNPREVNESVIVNNSGQSRSIDIQIVFFPPFLLGNGGVYLNYLNQNPKGNLQSLAQVEWQSCTLLAAIPSRPWIIEFKGINPSIFAVAEVSGASVTILGGIFNVDSAGHFRFSPDSVVLAATSVSGNYMNIIPFNATGVSVDAIPILKPEITGFLMGSQNGQELILDARLNINATANDMLKLFSTSGTPFAILDGESEVSITFDFQAGGFRVDAPPPLLAPAPLLPLTPKPAVAEPPIPSPISTHAYSPAPAYAPSPAESRHMSPEAAGYKHRMPYPQRQNGNI